MKREFKYKDSFVEIRDESLWQDNESVHQLEYTKIYSNDNKAIVSDNSTRYGIILRNSQKEIIDNCLLVCSSGSPNSIDEKIYFIENDRIYICISNMLFSLEIKELKLIWYREVDFATAFEIYKMKEDFIIHGEMYITRINKEGKIIWQESGSDIFVLPDGKTSFFIKDNIINAKSWDNRKYFINYDGMVISD